MDIAIIGAGNVGRSLATAAARAGHSVTIASSDPEDARSVADAAGARPTTSNAEAIAAADIVVLAVPYTSIDAIVEESADALADKIVIDVSNPFTPDLTGLPGTSVAEQIQARVPAARVVKAFNTIFASRQADPVVDGSQLDALVAADDASAKEQVLELVRSLGFRPVDAGPLVTARNLEAMGLLHIGLHMRNAGSWQSGWKLVGPAPTAVPVAA